MQISQSGTYAILNDYAPNNTFKEWRYLVQGTKCDDALVLPQTTTTKPSYDPKVQTLVETRTVRQSDVLQSWQVQNLTAQQIKDRKRPDGKGFQLEMITDATLLKIYQKILATNLTSGIWLNEVRAAFYAYTPDGFTTAINNLAQSAALTRAEITSVNAALYKYDLELITWLPLL